MLVIPAIDLRGGQCVRLRQGDYARETVFGADPTAMARTWQSQGATYLHLVDLDGARQGRPVNVESVQAIVRDSGVPCELGGGLREAEQIESALAWGIDRVVLGTRALRQPAWLAEQCGRFPGRIVLGLDARGGRLATDGWEQQSGVAARELALEVADFGLAAIIYTDIQRDGMMTGPPLSDLAELAESVPVPIIASGGIHTCEDVRSLAELPLAGCIIGRALYEGRLGLPDAIRAAHARDMDRFSQS